MASYIREEYKLRLFENRMLMRIFGPKRDENGLWRRLHNKELRQFVLIWVIKSGTLRCADYVAKKKDGKSAFKILTRKVAEKRPLGRPSRNLEDSITMDLKETVPI